MHNTILQEKISTCSDDLDWHRKFTSKLQIHIFFYVYCDMEYDSDYALCIFHVVVWVHLV